MTQQFHTVHNVSPQFFILSRDGNIRINGCRKVIGFWYVKHPRTSKEEKYVRLRKDGYKLVETIYYASIEGLDNGFLFTSYTMKEMKETLQGATRHYGLDYSI